MKILDKLAKSKAKNHLCFWPIAWMVTMTNAVKCRNLVHFHCGFSELLFSTILLFWHLFRRQVFGLCQNQKENIFNYLHFLFLFSFFLHKFLRNNRNKSKIKKKSTSRTTDDDLYSIAVSTSFSQAVTAAKLQQKMIASV